MARIGIDARLIGQTGVGVYIRNLLYHLTKIDTKNEYIVFYREADSNILPLLGNNFTLKIANQQWHSLAEQLQFLYLLIRQHLDLMHFTYFSFPIFYWRPFVITIHDLIPLQFPTGQASKLHPWLYYLKLMVAKVVFAVACRRADKIFTPSNTVKNELQQYFAFLDVDKCKTTYEGLDYRYQKFAKQHFSNKSKTSDYLLYLGNFYPHKNISYLLSAMKLLANNIQLVLKGPNDFFSSQIAKQINLLKLENKVKLITTSLSDQEFLDLLVNAKALVSASKQEGFGLTLLEARSFGVPVIATNLAVFDEILSPNGYLALDISDPNSLNSCLQQLEAGVKLVPLSSELDFQFMTQKTLDIYNQVLDNTAHDKKYS